MTRPSVFEAAIRMPEPTPGTAGRRRAFRGFAAALLPMLSIAAAFSAAARAESLSLQEQSCTDAIRVRLVPAAQRAVGREDGTGIVAEACKPWPYDPKLTLAVVAYALGNSDADIGERTLRQVVAVLGADGRVLARFSEDVGEDAAVEYAERSLRLDTARYDLAPGVRAFGVHFGSVARGASCPDRNFEDQLTLYVRDGAKLRPVFATFLNVQSALEGGLCAWTEAKSVVESASISLSVGKGRSHGYADLVSTAAVEGDDRQGVDRRVQHTFRYDGRHYDLDAYGAALYWEKQPDPR